MHWLGDPAHARWLETETDRLLAVTRRAVSPGGGFGWLDDDVVLRPDDQVPLWLSCRMTYVSALGVLLGRPGFTGLVDHGLDVLRGRLGDHRHGGWYALVGPDGPIDTTKAGYAHAFVVLAAAAAHVVGRPLAHDLLTDALEVQERYFWDEGAGLCRESWDRTFTEPEPYRGVNANMHTVEAYLAATDALGDTVWLDRAARITERVVHGFAREGGWRLPEHYDADWHPLPDHNRDQPAHPFRPYGATVGHGMEWSRLTLQVHASLEAHGRPAPAWMPEDATALFEASVRDGWAADGTDGFVYTVDWSGEPVVRERMHWVLTEAIGAAAALHTATGEDRYDALYRQWWDHAEATFMDHERGSWVHELSPAFEPSTTVWSGKPDTYHAIQATLVPRLPLAPAFAAALAQGRLDAR